MATITKETLEFDPSHRLLPIIAPFSTRSHMSSILSTPSRAFIKSLVQGCQSSRTVLASTYRIYIKTETSPYNSVLYTGGQFQSIRTIPADTHLPAISSKKLHIERRRVCRPEWNIEREREKRTQEYRYRERGRGVP